MKNLKLFFLAISLIIIQQESKAQNVFSKLDEKTGLFGFVEADESAL